RADTLLSISRNGTSNPGAARSQDRRRYFCSSVATRKGHDQPVCYARRGSGCCFLSFSDNHYRKSVSLRLPDLVAQGYSIATRGVVLDHCERRPIPGNERSCRIKVGKEIRPSPLGANGFGESRCHARICDVENYGTIGQRRL